ncbi:patatin-like phospholipase family protein [Nocardioides sp. NPDC057577]|uniref:patatin-like phospholipase family protein n=1 Tax=Nocardioides sp. NPDC057577 TaxID=3346171 RepID=UPI00366CB751
MDATQSGVVELLRSRLGGHGGNKDDGATLALVIEGGGMRGMLSATMAAVLADQGVVDAVDLVVGTSAGAANATAVAAGTIGAFSESYASVFASPEYIGAGRMLRRKSMVDTRGITARSAELFEWSLALREAAPRLAAVATDVMTAKAVPLTDFTGPTDLTDSVIASSQLPLAGGLPVTVRGRRWLDGGLVEAVPVASAAALGATHAIVLVTRPFGTAPAYGPADRVIERYLHRVNPELGGLYRGRPERYRSTVAQMRAGSYAGVSTLTFAPDADDPIPGRTETDVDLLRVAREAAAATATRMLAQAGLA